MNYGRPMALCNKGRSFRFVVICIQCFICLFAQSRAQRLNKVPEYPCPDVSAIQWVRDPLDCTAYFICHFGQPLTMPACPYSQVWSNSARNCVPEGSRWDDCEANLKHRASTRRPPPSLTAHPTSQATTRRTDYNVVINNDDSNSIRRKTRRQNWLFTTKPTVARVGGPTEKEKVAKPTGQTPRLKWRTTTAWFRAGTHPKPPYRRTTRPTSRTQETRLTTRPTRLTRPSRVTRPRPTSIWPTRPTVSATLTKPTKPPTKHGKVKVKPTFKSSPFTPWPTTIWSMRRTTERVSYVTVLPGWTRKTAKEHKKRITTISTTQKQKQKQKQKGRTVKPIRKVTPRWHKTRKVTPRWHQTRKVTPKWHQTRKVTPRWHQTRKVTPRWHQTPRRTTVPAKTLPVTRRRHQTTTQWTTIRRRHTTTPSPKSLEDTINKDHPCYGQEGELIAHPDNCHWVYNCSRAALEPQWSHGDPYVKECRYPQLFDRKSVRCREFINVNCDTRFEPVDPCEYTMNQCQRANCIPCNRRYGSCRGRPNGIYPFHVTRWTPTFVTCFDQRNIAQDDCQEPTPIFSPEINDCVSLLEVPKERGGMRPDCSFRDDGYYPDEQGRCGIFFECRDRIFLSYDECPAGMVFDPLTLRCQPIDVAAPPCGTGKAPSCEKRDDGFHADLYGRCTYYFECRARRFVKYRTCDFGSFDPIHQECVIPNELIPKPCGLLPNPCENRDSGVFVDVDDGCKSYTECSRGFIVRKGRCSGNKIFNTASGKCDAVDRAPEPCGNGPSCRNKPDGRYPALSRGCSFYYECSNSTFRGFKQCTRSDGGFFFNAKEGKCDFPQNICHPCGYKWWGCSYSNLLR